MPRSLTPLNALTTALRSETLAGVYNEVAKAHATRKLQRRIKWRGCNISIENDKGSVRSGIDRDGHRWENVIQTPYGYLRATQTPNGTYAGGDEEHLDVLCVEHDDWENCPAFVIHQRKAGTVDHYDEDKVVLGCYTEDAARQAYLANYDQQGPQLIGAISVLPAEKLEQFIKAGRENWGRPLVLHARQKVMLHARQVEKAVAALEEHKEWLRGVVAVAKAGGPRDDEDIEAIEKALAPVLLAEQALAHSTFEVITDIEKSADGRPQRRLLKIIPSFDAIDVQNQLTVKDTIREAWPYYEQAGNVDVEHLTKKGTNKNFAEYKDIITAQGFKIPDNIDEVAGRDYYEIGRPVRDSFNTEECSFIAEIYQGHPVADWFWSTQTEVTPPWPWKPSIGGAAKLAEVVADNPDPIFGKGRTQKFEVLRQFRWNNVGVTLEAANHYVAPVEVVKDTQAISKGLEVHYTQETPMNSEMTKATDVLKAAMMNTAQDVLSDMLDSGQVSQNEALSLTGDIAKALEPIEAEAEVVKALDYGTITTDIANMTQGQAFTREGPSRRKVIRKARELLEDTHTGETPFQQGYEWGDDPVVDVANYLMDDDDCTEDEALEIAKSFFDLLQGS